jgi:hypothetical protein
MAISNYPNGFKDGVTVKQIPYVSTQNKDGNVFFVDSSPSGIGSNGNKGTFERPFATLDYAVSQCKPNKGDLIILAAGHTEESTSSAGINMNVAGITIQFMGEGSNRATLQCGTSGSIEAGAANITLVNPRFEATADATSGFRITGAADNFTIINGEWHDGAGIDTTDAIKIFESANGVKIHGWKYFKGDEAGTQKQSHIQWNEAHQLELKDIDITGDFATANLENLTCAGLDLILENIKLKNTNATPKPGISLVSTSSGFAKNIDIRVASGSNYVNDTADLNWDNNCLGYNADGEGGDPISPGTADSGVGSVLVVSKTLTSSAVVQAGVDITGVSSGGTLMIEDVFINTDATGLATGTNFQIDTDNAGGVTTLFAETVANLGANKTESLATGSVTAITGGVLETGKKLIAKSTVADCTGAGTITIVIKFRRVVAGATVAAA